MSGEPRLVLVGAGGLGCAAAPVLAGFASPLAIEVLDDDQVEASNLHRQVLHRAAEVGQPKADSLARAIARLAGDGGPRALARRVRIDRENALQLLAGADVVIDGSDNFATRFVVNDACVLLGVPLVHAAAIRWQGQLLGIDARRGGPCYRCLFEAPPAPAAAASCQEAGVAGPVVGVIGALAAEAALALLDGASPYARAGQRWLGQLHAYDGLGGELRVIRFARNPACLACGPAPLARLLPPSAYEVPAC